jgi:hypothetical protein
MKKSRQSLIKVTGETLCAIEGENCAKNRNSDEQKAERKADFGSWCNAVDSNGFLGGTSHIHSRA